MAIFSGSTKIKEILSGSTPIKEVRSGSSIVWKKSVTFDGIPPERFVMALSVASASSRASYIVNNNYFTPNAGDTQIANPYEDNGLDLSFIYTNSLTQGSFKIQPPSSRNRKLLVVCSPSTTKWRLDNGSITRGITIKQQTTEIVTVSVQSSSSSSNSTLAIYDITEIENIEPNICIAGAHPNDIINNTLFQVWLDSDTPSGYGYGVPNFRSKATLWLTGDNTSTISAKMEYSDGTSTNMSAKDVRWENETLLPLSTSPSGVSLAMVSFNITTPYV